MPVTSYQAKEQWTEIVSRLHLDLAPQSNHDTFEMGLIVGVLLSPTHGGVLRKGAAERLRQHGVDAAKVASASRAAFVQSRPAAPPSRRHVPDGYALLADGSLVNVAQLLTDARKRTIEPELAATTQE